MHTLPHYDIFVSPHHLAILNQNVWREETVPAYIDYGKGPRPIQLKYRGAHSRFYDKKSFYIKMNEREWHLNADAVDPSHIRSKWSFDLFAALSVLSPKAAHVTVSLNGQLLGIYTLLESVDRKFLARRRLPGGDVYYAVDNRANFSIALSGSGKKLKHALTEGYELKERISPLPWRSLAHFVWELNTLPDLRLASWLKTYVDIPYYLRWLAGIVLTGNLDGFIHNYALYRDLRRGKWRIIPWDYDGTWGRDCYGKRADASQVPLFGYNRLTERVLSVPPFRRHYLKLMAALLDGYFTPKHMMQHALSLMSRVRPAVSNAAGGRREIVQRFDAEADVFRSYIIQRRQFLKRELSKQMSIG